MALSPSLKAHFDSAGLALIKPLKLLVPASYPKNSPVLLDKFHAKAIQEFEDLPMKAKSKFCIAFGSLSQSISLGEMKRTWDACARKTILEYAQQRGEGVSSAPCMVLASLCRCLLLLAAFDISSAKCYITMVIFFVASWFQAPFSDSYLNWFAFMCYHTSLN